MQNIKYCRMIIWTHTSSHIAETNVWYLSHWQLQLPPTVLLTMVAPCTLWQTSLPRAVERWEYSLHTPADSPVLMLEKICEKVIHVNIYSKLESTSCAMTNELCYLSDCTLNPAWSPMFPSQPFGIYNLTNVRHPAWNNHWYDVTLLPYLAAGWWMFGGW